MTASQYFLKKITTGTQIPLGSLVTVGRSEDSNLRLIEGQPSRHHAQIVAEESSVFVEDLGSTNGTFVNGRRLDVKVRTRLSAGDRVRFDIEEFEFVAPLAKPAGDGDKTVFRAPDADKTVFRPQEPRVPAAESPQRTVIEPRRGANGAADAAAPAVSPAAVSPAAVSPAAVSPAAVSPAAVSPAPVSPAPVSPAAVSPAAEKPREPQPAPAAAAKPAGESPKKNLPKSFLDEGQKTVFIDPKKAKATLSQTTPAPSHGPGDRPYFWVASGGAAGQKLELTVSDPSQHVWRIGSGEDCNLRIQEAGVSGKHATLRHENRTWRLTDDVSVNGTFVNDKRVLKSYLSDGDRVRFGPVDCVFRTPPARETQQGAGGRWKKIGLIVAGAFVVTLVLLYVLMKFV